MGDPASSIVAEAALSEAPPDRTARLVLELGYADAQVAAIARDLAHGVLRHIEAMLADPATDLPADARAALAALADALSGQISGGASPQVGHAAGAGVPSPSRRAGSVRTPA